VSSEDQKVVVGPPLVVLLLRRRAVLKLARGKREEKKVSADRGLDRNSTRRGAQCSGGSLAMRYGRGKKKGKTRLKGGG